MSGGPNHIDPAAIAAGFYGAAKFEVHVAPGSVLFTITETGQPAAGVSFESRETIDHLIALIGSAANEAFEPIPRAESHPDEGEP